MQYFSNNQKNEKVVQIITEYMHTEINKICAEFIGLSGSPKTKHIFWNTNVMVLFGIMISYKEL